MTQLPTVKLDLHRSTLTTGIQRYLISRGIRRVRVTGLENNNRATWNATVAVLNLGGVLHHPGNTLLPLQKIHMERTGPFECVGVLLYAWDRFSFPPAAASTIAYFRGRRTESIPVWRYAGSGAGFGTPAFSNALPSGEMFMLSAEDRTDATKRPQTWMWRPGTIELILPTVLSFNPFNTGLDALLGKVNSDTVVFADTLFDVGTIRFDGIDVDWIQTGIGAGLGGNIGIQGIDPPPSHFQFRFATNYKFLIRRGAHKGQHPIPPGFDGPNMPPAWETREYLLFEKAAFANAFPVHA